MLLYIQPTLLRIGFMSMVFLWLTGPRSKTLGEIPLCLISSLEVLVLVACYEADRVPSTQRRHTLLKAAIRILSLLVRRLLPNIAPADCTRSCTTPFYTLPRAVPFMYTCWTTNPVFRRFLTSQLSPQCLRQKPRTIVSFSLSPTFTP